MVLDSTLALILGAKQRRLALENGNPIGEHQDSLPEIAQESHIRRLMNQTRLIRETCSSNRVVKWLATIEYQSMQIVTPYNEIEFLLGKEGQQASRKVFPMLCQWRESSLARRSVWHAGQVIRTIQSFTPGTSSDFYAFAAYQAGLCLWTYSIIPSGIGPNHGFRSALSNATNPAVASTELLINGPESIESQKWITHNRGVPVMYFHRLTARSHTNTDSIPLSSTKDLMHRIMDLLTEKFTIAGSYASIVENLCHLLEALGKCEPIPREEI